MAAAAAAAYTYLPVSTYCSYFPPARALHSLNQVNPPTQVNRSRSRELNRLLAPLTPSSLSHSLSLYSLHHHPIILFVPIRSFFSWSLLVLSPYPQFLRSLLLPIFSPFSLHLF